MIFDVEDNGVIECCRCRFPIDVLFAFARFDLADKVLCFLSASNLEAFSDALSKGGADTIPVLASRSFDGLKRHLNNSLPILGE